MVRTLLVILFSLAVALTASNLNIWAHEGHEGSQHDAQQVVAEEAKINIIGNIVGEEGNKVKVLCPVMKKNWFVIDEKTPRAVYKEKTYYFCCQGCKPQFEKDPEKYLKNDEKT